MFNLSRRGVIPILGVCAIIGLSAAVPYSPSQTTDEAIIHGIDDSVASRDQNVVTYTVTEHYSVFRNQEKTKPAAEMTVKTTYRQNEGKTFTVLNQSGSELLLKQVLGRILDSERTATQPANRATALLTSANYIMKVSGHEVVDGHNCVKLSISPRQSSPYLLVGSIWVDAENYSIVQLSGVTSKSASVLVGPSQVDRYYSTIDGFPMATRASAVSSSWLLGQTRIEIESSGYQIQRLPSH